MIKKTENCLYCGEPLHAITAKKKFCNDKCRIYYKRENGEKLPKEFTQVEEVVKQEQEADRKIKINTIKQPPSNKIHSLESLRNDLSSKKEMTIGEKIALEVQQKILNNKKNKK